MGCSFQDDWGNELIIFIMPIQQFAHTAVVELAYFLSPLTFNHS